MVRTGDIVKVRVIEVDVARKRISLTMKLDAPAQKGGGAERGADNRFRPAGRGEQPQRGGQGGRGALAPASQNAMAAAFAKLKSGR